MPSMSRRYFLMAGGTLVALPFFESLLPRQSRAAAVAALPQRMALFHAPCGFNMSTFTPTATGPGYPLSPTLKPLAALQKNMLVLSNMNNMSAINNNAGNGKHAIGMATLFTGAAVKYDQPQPAGSASVDQIYAKSQAGKTAVGSLQLGVRIDADCDVDLPCVDIMTVSWADANTPLAAQTDPIAVFNNFFSGGSSQQAATAQAARRATRQSVLDAVLGQANGLSKKLGSADSQKLDQYLTSVRALEMQLGATPSASCSPANAVPASIGSSDYQTLYSTMMKLMVLAFQCDLTRSISFSFGEGHCDHLYDFLPGINDIHHSISHHDGDPNKLAQLTTIDTWEMSIFSQFLAGLQAIPEGSGTLLDNTVAALSSELADGSAHNFNGLAFILAGKGGGFLKNGQHLMIGDNKTPGDVSQVWLTLLRNMGVNVPSFGQFNVTQTLPDILA